MELRDFIAGNWLKGYEYRYFLPEKINHTFVWTDESISELLERASLKLGELNSFARFVPDADMFIRMHVFNEAVLSSRIEGTQTSIEEALLEEREVNPERHDDWQEVTNYVAAMNYAIEELNRLPLSSRLIRETHRRLMQSVRGEKKVPGEFRTSQNWIGGATLKDAIFIPPVHTEVDDLMGDLELFLHNEEIRVPHLIRIAIAHYQFETIHPFLDGNGRIGRLLISLYLVSRKILDRPLLYLSDFFERNKGLYYDNLTQVRMKNDITQWIKFFLTAVAETAEKSITTLNSIVLLKNSLEKELFPALGKRLESGRKLFIALFSQPIVMGRNVEEITSLSPKAANDLISIFVDKGILKEITGYQRNRVFVFYTYLDLFRK
jgi:Fic family protein